MNYNELTELLFPNIDKTPEYFEELYPKRNVPDGACVTRIGPSPTGFVHLGNLYNAIIGERLAHQSNGVIFLRIEDTDSKREVEGAVETIIKSMNYFGINFDEGVTLTEDKGIYAPYKQSNRKEIYQTFAKKLVQMGFAYPCFCTEDELSKMHEEQENSKDNFGYYGKYAIWRDRPIEDIKEKLSNGEPYVLRFRSTGDINNYVSVQDGIRGELKVQENYQDFVLLKSDGIPTYHFAHVVDDHLMRTTHVIRGEEWLATLPIHVQLFDTLGWDRPLYCHTPQLMKIDEETGKKRKLSKRKDPELALAYYVSEGYIPEAVWVYLLTVLNSNFEEWFNANPDKSYLEFPFSLNKMSNSGALLDIPKFNDVSKEVISRLSANYIYNGIKEWSKTYDETFYKAFTSNEEYSKKVIDIGRSGNKPRKDIENWKQASKFLSFYFDDTFSMEDDFPVNAQGSDKDIILTKYLATLNFNDTQEEWFNKVRAIAEELNYALQPKKYKKNPELYKGSIVDVSNVIRVALTGRQNSPDIYEISQAMGETMVRNRLSKFIDN
ncbi:MAG: glutamate--tRNA ligase [Oscillospiraceae bacterium]